MQKKYYAMAIFLLALFTQCAHAHTVTINFAYHIGNDKNDTIHVDGNDFKGTDFIFENYDTLEKPYMSSQRDGVVAALIFSGHRFVNGVFQTAYSPEDYLFQITQDDKNNRAIIAFTKGSWHNIEAQQSSLTYGEFSYKSPKSFMNFLRLDFNDIDIVGNAVVEGEKTIFVKNLGISGNKKQIEIGVIE